MRNKLMCAAVAATLWAGSAAAVNVDNFEIPYVGAAYLYEFSDSARDSKNGQGFQLQFGLPLAEFGFSNWAAELTYHDLGRKRDIDRRKDYQSGLMLDFVYDLGNYAWGDEAALSPRFKPFLLAGLGVVNDDVRGNDVNRFGINLGAGLLFPLNWHGLAARLEARVLGQDNDKSVPGEDILIDYRVSLGLQVPLTPLFRASEKSVAPAQDCGLAVVDPATGRSDCGADSDRDGVPDSADECPLTPEGTPVDARGCPVDLSNDEDGDGVPNHLDACPGTQKGLRVDARGCVVAQTAVLRGVNFENDSARLTVEAKRLLDDSAQTLKNQSNLSVLVAGHTDSNGDDAYNLSLSQQRAESVRQYLIGRGVPASRLSAQGFGESQPAESNDTAAGRAANRRVEFRLVVE